MYTRSKYKASTPETTVSRIESICKELGFEFDIVEYSNNVKDHSCRIKLINDGLESFNLGTNGKGMNEVFAKASAYGEFMERLQNKALFRTNLKYATKYYIDRIPNCFWKDTLVNPPATPRHSPPPLRCRLAAPRRASFFAGHLTH